MRHTPQPDPGKASSQASAFLVRFLSSDKLSSRQKKLVLQDLSSWRDYVSQLFSQEERQGKRVSNSPRQRFASSRTSTRQIPAIIKRIAWEPGTVCFDIGGGAFDEASTWLAERGVLNLVYDPFNRSAEENERVLQTVKDYGVDVVVVANVLNVISDVESRLEVIQRAAQALAGTKGVAFFSIYEGDRSGKGRATGADRWQNNKKTKFYVPEIKRFFSIVTRKENFIIASSPRV